MILYINTKDQKIISVSLKEKGKVIKTLSKENEFGSQVLLSLITKILEIKKTKLEDLKEIEVAIGPGSYTGLKVGVSVANALAYSLGIPVNGKKMEVELNY